MRRNAQRLPDAVYRDLIDMLFSMTIPVAFMGTAFAGVAVIVGWSFADPIVTGLGIAAALVTILRLVTIRLYRGARTTPDLAALARWERRYALGNYAFALLLGLFNVRALMFHNPLLHLIGVSLVFAFGAGVVSRISIRPVICVASLLLAAVPTAVALFLHSFTGGHRTLHAELFVIEAMIVAATTLLSLQSVHHLYNSMVQHLTVKHDLGQLATRDALTGLPNRLLLRERFQKDAARISRASTRLALHFLDLDGFKAVNDLNGHPAGDIILREVAARLGGVVRAEDTLCRLGGDEFVVLQASIRHEAEAEMLARRIIKRLSAPYRIGDTDVRLSVSIGIDVTGDGTLDLEGLIARADTALYVAKTSGKGRFTFYKADLDAGEAAAPPHTQAL